MRRLLLTATLVLGTLGSVATTVRAQDGPPPPKVETWSLETTGRLGEAMYRQDRLAIRASEALARRFPDAPPTAPTGWIVVDDEDGAVVRFFSETDGAVRPLYDVTMAGERATGVVDAPDAAYPPRQLAMIAARRTAIHNIGELRCGGYNSIILPDVEGDGWLVWLMATTNDANDSSHQGHYRFRISADGRSLIRRDQLFDFCGNTPAGPSLMSMYAHEIADGPLETDVYLSLVEHQVMCVKAGDVVYSVDGATITTGAAPRRRMSRSRPLTGQNLCLGRPFPPEIGRSPAPAS